MPVWQSIYEEINDPNFVIISAAQDTGGEMAAGKIFDEAGVTYKAIIDQEHTISTLYNLVNVPSGVWINEEGKVVRINEGTYAAYHKLGTLEFGSDVYVPALKDWLLKGSESEFVWSPEQVSSKIVTRTEDAEQAEPAFKLGVHFHRQGNETKANEWWEESQRLNPASWNFARQDWSFTPSQANANWLKKVQTLNGKPYYQPLELPSE